MTADNAGLVKERLGLCIEGILARVDDLADAGVDDHLRAGQARGKRDVDGGAGQANAVIGRLADGVLLGVDADALVQRGPALHIAGTTRAPALKAVANAARRAVVARRDNAAVGHDHRGHLPARAVRSHPHDLGDLHEIGIPIRPQILVLSLLHGD